MEWCKFLIIGGTGFIDSTVIRHIINSPYQSVEEFLLSCINSSKLKGTT
jgi:hypothetical protein